jgi:hypothetical protein
MTIELVSLLRDSLTLCKAAAKAKGGSFESVNRNLKDTPPTSKSKKVTSTLGV